MNETALVQKVWNYAHVVRDQGVPYQAYILQISHLLFLKMDDERVRLAAVGIKNGSAIPEECCWPVLRDPQGEELTRRYSRSSISCRAIPASSARFFSKRKTRSRTRPSCSV